MAQSSAMCFSLGRTLVHRFVNNAAHHAGGRFECVKLSKNCGSSGPERIKVYKKGYKANVLLYIPLIFAG